MGGSPAPPRPSGGRKRLHAPACSTAPRYSRARARVCQLPDTATATAFLALVDGLQPGRTRQDELHAATRDEAGIGQLPEEEADRLPRSADQRPDLLVCQRQSDREALTIPVAVLQPDSQEEPRQTAARAQRNQILSATLEINDTPGEPLRHRIQDRVVGSQQPNEGGAGNVQNPRPNPGSTEPFSAPVAHHRCLPEAFARSDVPE